MNRPTALFVLIFLVAGAACHKDSSPAPLPPPPPPQPTVYPVTGVSSTAPAAILLEPDSSFRLATTVSPANATNPKLIYTTGDAAVCTVDTGGRITAKRLGLTTVTATSADNAAAAFTVQVAVVKHYTVYAGGSAPYDLARRPILWTNSSYSQLTTDNDSYGEILGLTIAGNDLYAAGWIQNRQLWQMSAYWKNGVPVIVGRDPALMPLDYLQETLTAVAVSGTRTILTGYNSREVTNPIWNPGAINVTVWNGYYYSIEGNGQTRTLLATDTSNVFTQAYALTTSGNDVYVAGAWAAGRQNRVATYWKNDPNGAVALAPNGDWSEAVGIAVQGADVFVAGYEQCPNVGCRPTVKLWKNNMYTAVNLTDGTGWAYPRCLAINDTAEFVGGYQENADGVKQSMLWRVKGNTVTPIVLSGQSGESVVNGITVSGNDVFLAGYQVNSYGSRIATYWRASGNIVSATALATTKFVDADYFSEANAIFVK